MANESTSESTDNHPRKSRGKSNRWSQLLREFPQVESIAPEPLKTFKSKPAVKSVESPEMPRPVEKAASPQMPFSLEPLEAPKAPALKNFAPKEPAPAKAVRPKSEVVQKTAPPVFDFAPPQSPQLDADDEAFEESEPHVFSVSEINKSVKGQLEGNFRDIWLQGEISNFKAHTSGHFYFSLKDAKAQISAVMFRGMNGRLKFTPESGMEVLVRGKITVYEPRGNYQFFCEHMEPVGAGALQKAFEQLKARLKSEGLFDESRKKPLPPFPQKVGVVTSPTGAAIRDILNVLARRSPRIEVTVIPARVQGATAAAEVSAGIALANRVGGFDVLIVGRGGGSIEDLWGFNEEPVARAIAASEIPIISSVGHEVDFTISDFVADLRAPTPSAAAELVAQSEEQLQERLKFSLKALSSMIRQKLDDHKNHLEFYGKRLKDPRVSLRDSALRCDELTSRLIQNLKSKLRHDHLRVQSVRGRLQNPKVSLERAQLKLRSAEGRLQGSIKATVLARRRKWEQNSALLDSLSPLKVIDRGFAIVKSKNKIVRSVDSQKVGDAIEIQLHDGFVSAEIKKITRGEKS